jgi:hypothetical protein
LPYLNIIDKISLVISHFKEIDRLAKKSGVQFLFSDPFSWSDDIAQEKNWLGGKDSGPRAGGGRLRKRDIFGGRFASTGTSLN